MMPPPAENFDAAIVLGAMILSDGSPSPALARRVARAVALARSGRVGHLLMTGGPVRHPKPESHVMRDMAVAAGIAPDRIVTEEASVNTIGNARLCRPIVAQRGWRRLLLVTDACHIPRSLYVFHRLGLRVSPSAVWPVWPPAREWWLAWPREAAALPWTMIRVERLKLKETP
ncbi:YdcF family protein [Paramagnetospirillum kuznetsovii]|uniref:YdcF family protein n=1 Tax=Paramagnetospirillum kuznetsovii TaxID=2053833 RepID=A0A364NSR5_9PROT|nr:YdcF family protein [Paramagnetospirillum kuznetsovii]RAU20131.1 YdcF family protein [Paramagnetospirillum kuznetsovii]